MRRTIPPLQLPSLPRLGAPLALCVALAGVAIDVPAAVRLAPVVLPLVLLRIGALMLGVRLGSGGLELERVQRRAVWQGLVAQAGVAIGLVGIVAEAYPEAGVSMRTMLLAIIAVNGTLGPILFRRGLIMAGETDGDEDHPDAAAAAAALPAPTTG